MLNFNWAHIESIKRLGERTFLQSPISWSVDMVSIFYYCTCLRLSQQYFTILSVRSGVQTADLCLSISFYFNVFRSGAGFYCVVQETSNLLKVGFLFGCHWLACKPQRCSYLHLPKAGIKSIWRHAWVKKQAKQNKQTETTFFFFFWFFGFSRQGLSVALEPVRELAVVGQTGLEITEICLPLPSECWD